MNPIRHIVRKLYTTDPNFKFHSSFAKINAVQSLAKGLTHGRTVVEYIDLKSVGTAKHDSGRTIIASEWFQTTLTERAKAEGFTAVGFHMTPKVRSRFRLASTIKGKHIKDKDGIIEYYVIASTAKELERRIEHEEGHEFEPFFSGDRKDPLHYYAFGNDYEGFYSRVDLTKGTSQLDTLQAQLVALLAQLNPMKRDFLQICTDALGTDVTPDDLVPDVVACAVTVTTLIRKVDSTFPLVAGTWTLMDVLDHAKTWQRVTAPVPGCIVLSPTGTGKKGTVGHVGVYMADGKIASNNSQTGKFEKNYDMKTWKARYADTQGMPVYLYAKRGSVVGIG